MLPGEDERFMRSLAEAAKAVMSTFEPKKIIYINFLTEIQPECDCMPCADVPVIQDIGILISEDIVSVEKASMDMLAEAEPLPQSVASEKDIRKGEDIIAKLHHKPYILQVDEAEKLGLGSATYELVRI